MHIGVRLGLWIGAVASLAVAGCAPLGPDFEMPETPLAERWDQPLAQGLSANPASEGQWWQQFNDPVLDSLISEARLGNYSLRAAGLNVLAARAQLGIAVGNRYPQSQQVRANATVLEASQANANTAGAADLEYTQYGLSFEAGWELDFWGRFQRGIEAADASLGATIADYDNALLLLTAQVAAVYTGYRSTEEELRIARENLVLQQRSHDIADVLFRNGENSELDMQQARTLLLSTEATLPTLETQLRQQINALSVLLGSNHADISALLGTPAPIPSTESDIALGVPADLLRRRPDVRAAEWVARAQSARIGIAEADLYPSVALSGSIGIAAAGNTRTTGSGKSGVDALLDQDALTWSMGPSFSWKILNYGRLKNTIRVQDALLQQSLERYRDTVLRAGQEVEDAMAAFTGARAAEHILEQVVAAARRSSELALLQYQEGLADYQRVLDSQQSLFAQQRRHLQARTQSTSSLIALYKALGGGWEIRGDAPLVDEATLRQMRERTDWGTLLETTPASGSNPDAPRRPDW